MDEIERVLGLLDAAFAYLNICYPNDIEKKQATEAVTTLLHVWGKVGLNIILKAHIMEQHACSFNDKQGVGDKEESFVEQGHQVGAKENSRYAWLTNFEKKTKSILNARLQAMHPLVTQHKLEVQKKSKRKRSDQGYAAIKSIKEEKKIKREYYMSNCKEEEEKQEEGM
jgi:hypothetical protein